MVRIDFDQSRWFVLSLVLEAEHATVVVNVVVGDTAPQKFNHLILKKHVHSGMKLIFKNFFRIITNLKRVSLKIDCNLFSSIFCARLKFEA